MLQPGITVGIPTFNRALALEETVLAATRVATEQVHVLVVDDGSTDMTAHVLQQFRYQGAVVRTVTHASNQGLAGSLSSMLRNSLTSHLLLFEDDGILNPAQFSEALDFVTTVQPALLGTQLEPCDDIAFKPISPEGFSGAHHAPGWLISVVHAKSFLSIFEIRRADKCEFVQIYPQKFFATALIASSDNCWYSTLCLVKESRNLPQQLTSTHSKKINDLKAQINMYFDFFVSCDVLERSFPDNSFCSRILLMKKVWRKEGRFRFLPGRFSNFLFFSLVRCARQARLKASTLCKIK